MSVPLDVQRYILSYIYIDICDCNEYPHKCRCGLDNNYNLLLISKKYNWIYIGSITYPYESEFSKKRGYDGYDMFNTYRILYDAYNKLFIIEDMKYCMTCYINLLDYPEDETIKSEKTKVVDKIKLDDAEYIMKNNLRNVKLNKEYIQLKSDDCDYCEIDYLYKIAIEWCNKYKHLL